MKTVTSKVKITKDLTKVNFTDANRGKGQIKYIVKHYVGATGGAKENCTYFRDTYRGASAHYFVGHDGEIWQCVEDKDIAWHCGAPEYRHPECRNSNSIGVELCVKKDKKGRWYYTEATKKAAVELFIYLMDKYGIDEKHVLRHYDVTGKICPEPDVRKGNKVWSQFQAAIAGHGKTAQADTTETAQKAGTAETGKPAADAQAPEGWKLPCTIVTTCDSLNIRKKPNGKVTGQINESGTKNLYTIVEVQDGWGRLKSGAGWIYLKYAKAAGSTS